MLKKGGIADIVTLMVIVGLVVALIVAVVLPMTRQADQAGADNSAMLKGISTYTSKLTQTGASGSTGLYDI